MEKRIRTGWVAFGNYKEIFTDRDLRINLKRKTFNTCIKPAIAYGCETWMMTKGIKQKLEVCQRLMKRKMLGVNLKDSIKNTALTEIRKRTGVTDIVEHIAAAKWRWAGHVNRMSDNQWTVRTTEWQVQSKMADRDKYEGMI